MTRTTGRLLLAGTAVLAAALLAAFLLRNDLVRDRPLPGDVPALGRWLAAHPADWRGSNAMAAAALDAPVPRPRELWRAAYVHSRRLAPRRPQVATSFVRGGLLHWYELDPPDRRTVLAEAAPLLRDPVTFAAMYRPLWELTGDLGYLRRNAPDTETALIALREIAVTNGLFAEYRQLRDAIDRKRLVAFETRRNALSPPELIALLPPKLRRSDEPLARRVLAELHRRPLDVGTAPAARPHADELARFAIRYGLRPLDGLDALIDTPSADAPTRARLALALGRVQAAADIELTGRADEGEEWVDYYLERSAFEAARGEHDVAALYQKRAELARFLTAEDPLVWTGTCGKNEVCTSAAAYFVTPRSGTTVELPLQTVRSDDVAPYVEIYVEDERVAEGPVVAAQRFRVPLTRAGGNRVEVRIANPWTRNGVQRRVRLS